MSKNDVQTIPAEVMSELLAAAEQAVSDFRDPELMRKACERMDRMREDNRRIYGEQNIGVDIIREMRDAR